MPAVVKKFPIHPKHPERICWGCDKYCPADSLMCGNGSVATPHPCELFGEDWMSCSTPRVHPPVPGTGVKPRIHGHDSEMDALGARPSCGGANRAPAPH
jgi:hypothetical protein